MENSKIELEINGKLDINEFSEIHNELLFYLEDKVKYGTATEMELNVYEDYKLFDTFDVDSEVCKRLIREMQEIYGADY